MSVLILVWFAMIFISVGINFVGFVLDVVVQPIVFHIVLGKCLDLVGMFRFGGMFRPFGGMFRLIWECLDSFGNAMIFPNV